MIKRRLYTTTNIIAVSAFGLLLLTALNASLRTITTLFEPFWTLQEENTVGVISAFVIMPALLGILFMSLDGWDEE